MSDRPPRYRTGSPSLDAQLNELLDELGVRDNRDQIFEIMATVIRLAGDHPDRLDLKITNAALREMRQAFRVFAPYREVPKVTIFGSARTAPTDEAYAQARDVAHALAGRGWMVITGAGPGVMAAGLEGAGRAMSFGINIRLPFEQGANEFIANDPKLVEMKYFFTRKLMLMKESDGFIALPGGFGTLDEMLELLTLVQTGKAEPSPLVLLDHRGGHYWHAWDDFVHAEVASRGFIDEDDRALYRITDDCDAAVHEITSFYRNYHSRRFVGQRLVVRLRAEPTDEELERLNAQFGDICASGRIEKSGPLSAEIEDNDHLNLARILFVFDRRQHGRFRLLIDALNNLQSAPSEAPGPADREIVAGGRPMEADVAAREHEEQGSTA